MVTGTDEGTLRMGAMLVRQEPTSAAAVRKRLGADLTADGLSGDSVDDVVLVASELVGNAIRHAGSGELDVTWTIAATQVLVSVADEDHHAPEPRNASPEQAGGRGLTILSALCTEWGVEPTRTGKRVWATVPVVRG